MNTTETPEEKKPKTFEEKTKELRAWRSRYTPHKGAKELARNKK